MDDAGGGSRAPASAAVSSSDEIQVDQVSVDRGSNFLVDTILSWTVGEAINEDLYKEACSEVIPAQFKSLDHYKQVQCDFLIEEVRARVNSGINHIQTADFYHVLAVLDVDSSEHLFFDIDVARLSKNGVNHSAKDGDIFLLTMESPADTEPDNSCFLGIAVEVGADNSFQKSFRILVSSKHSRCLVKTVKFVSFLTNIAEEMNISRSISSGAFNAMKLILEKNESCSTCCSETKQLMLSDKYNRNQAHCITSILSKLSCEHENSVQIVWGSPGTGKTLLACALMNFLMNSRRRIVVCVPRVQSITSLLSDLKYEFPDFEFSNLIVLNELNGTFAATSLESRSLELYCAVPLWKSFTKKMAWILALEIYMPKVGPVEQHTSRKNMVVQFSFASFKRKFLMVLEDVKSCSIALISALSRKCLTHQEIDKVNNMISMLLRFQELMENDITDSHVKVAFSIPETSPRPSNSNKYVPKIAYDLNDTRISCIELIKDLLGVVTVPDLDGWKDLEQFCIQHSQIVVCTPDYSSQLHNLDFKLDILVVDDASHIRESSLLVPLSIEPRHIVLIGDHMHVQPMVASQVCKKAGYAISLFERLLKLSFDKKILSEQYVMNPILSKLHGKLFYEHIISDGLDHNDFLKDLRYGPCCFLDIADVKELRSHGTSFVESSLILLLLEDLCKGLTSSKESISVGIVCLCSMRANALKDELCVQYEGQSRVCVEVISIENLHYGYKLHEAYDIVILSSACKDPILLLEGSRLNVFLSSSRHCIWIIGEAGILLSSNGALEKLGQHINVSRIQSSTLSQAMQQLKMRNKDCPSDANPTCQNFSSQKTGQQYTLKGRPYRTKNIMPDLRDQKDDPGKLLLECSSKKLQYADFDPPKDFEFSMSLAHLKDQYEKLVNSPFLETSKGERGRQRLETEMDILQKDGVKGYNKMESEVIFKISRYERLGMKEKRVQFSDIRKHLRSGKLLACHFRISRNYFYLKPGECYEFDATQAYIHPKSELPISHAVIGTGFGLLPLVVPEGQHRTHVTIQNSIGPRFGYDGSGTVLRDSLRGAYIMSPGEESSIDTNNKSSSVEGAPEVGVLVQVDQLGEQGAV